MEALNAAPVRNPERLDRLQALVSTPTEDDNSVAAIFHIKKRQ